MFIELHSSVGWVGFDSHYSGPPGSRIPDPCLTAGH